MQRCLAAAVLALTDCGIARRLEQWRERQTLEVAESPV
jgi:phosphoribosylcarboxyaminoimidazole (NCAIR) mutase